MKWSNLTWIFSSLFKADSNLSSYAEIGDILQEACNLIKDATGISQKLCILVDSKEICSATFDQSTSDWKRRFRGAMELAGIVNLHNCLVSPSPADKHNQWSRMAVMI